MIRDSAGVIAASAILLASASIVAMVSAQDDPVVQPPAISDPAPPIVHTLDPFPAPVAQSFPELTFYKPAKPLAKDAVTEDWPGFLGPHRNGHSAETKLLHDFSDGGPPLVWEMACGQGYSCPVVQDDHLVFTHRVGDTVHIDCLDTETGKRFWRFSYACEYRDRYVADRGPRSTPIIDDDHVYVHGVEGSLHCLELATGRVIWQRNISEEFGVKQQFFGVVASPLIHGDLLIQSIGGADGPTVAAFDKHNGRLVWGAGSKWGPSCASPIVAEVQGRTWLYVLTGGDSRPPTGGLMIIDPVSGEVAFEYPFRSRTYESVNGATPIVGDDRVFITASYGTGTAGIEAKPDGTFSELWKTRSVGMQFSNPLYVNGNLYAIDGHSDRIGEIICLDPVTGEELSRVDISWDEKLLYQGSEKDLSMSIGEGSMLFVDGKGLVLGDNGHLLWIDLKPDGVKVLARTSLFRASQSWSPPVLSRGLLYVRQNKRERFGQAPSPRRLMCFDLRGGAHVNKDTPHKINDQK